MVLPADHAELVEQREPAPPGLRAVAPRVARREQDVLERGERRQQQERLEDEADPPPARAALGRARQRADAHVFVHDLARVGVLEESEDAEERALAGAGLPDDRDQLAALHHEVHPAQDRDRLAPGGPVRLPVTASASPKTSRARSRSVAPSARLTPKSRIRSKTAAAIVLASDRPPITSASAPIPTSSAAKNAVEARSSRDSSLGSCTLTSGTSAMIRRATASGSSPSRQPTATPVLRSAAVSAAAPDASRVRSIRSFATHCSRASSIGTNTNRSGAVTMRSRIPTTPYSALSSGSREPTPIPRPATEIWPRTRRSPPSRKRTMRSLMAPSATTPATPIAIPAIANA